MDKMAQRTREVGGVKKSLVDVGYTRAGLDDNWQVCNVFAGNTLCSVLIYNISCELINGRRAELGLTEASTTKTADHLLI